MPDGRIQLVPFLRVAVALALGIAAGTYLCLPHAVWAGVSTLMMVAVWRSGHHPVLKGAVLMAAVAVLGAWWTQVYLQRQQQVPQGMLACQAVVMSEPEVHGRVARCDLYLVGGRYADCRIRASFLCTDGEPTDMQQASPSPLLLAVGDGVTLTAYMTPAAAAPPAYRRWLLLHRYAAQTLVLPGRWQPAVFSLRPCSRWLRLRLSALRLRGQPLQRLRQYGAGRGAFPVLAAMTVGDKTALSGPLRRLYADTGASHVLALSGMHLSVWVVALSLLFFRRRHGEARRGPGGRRVGPVGYVALVTLVWGYVLMAGMPPGMVRAALMLTLCCTGLLAGRSAVSLNSLCLTAVVMLCANPLSLWDVSFQLSFMAVLSILLCYKPLMLLVPQRVQACAPLRWVAGMAAVSVAAQAGTAPLVLYHFGQVACCFLLTNMVAVPLVSVIVPLAMAFFVLSWPAAVPAAVPAFAARCLDALARLLNLSLQGIAHLPGATLTGLHADGWQVAALYLAEACLYLLAYRLYRAHCRASAAVPVSWWQV